MEASRNVSLTSGPSSIDLAPLTSQGQKRSLDGSSHEFGSNLHDKRMRRHSRGHEYSGLVLKGHTRAHLGNVYNFFAPSAPSSKSGIDTAAELIAWLDYPRRDARREMIHSAHHETFQWIFDENPSEDYGTVPFAQWLKTGKGLYWIKGKPGSGKSTLMKMIGEDTRTRDLLAQWSAGRQVITSCFYFWLAGTDMQRSILGLLRSILRDLLHARQDLAELVYPGWQPRFSAQEPTFPEARGALLRIIDECVLENHICLVVDGLDEYEGSENEKATLVELFERFAHHDNVKVVVSSRPLRIFESSLDRWSCLSIHELTYQDILVLVADSLAANECYHRMSDIDPNWSSKFTACIAARSAGVFLWAIWAVAVVLEGCRHMDRPQELDRRLEKVPEELEELFVKMLQQIPSSYRREGYRYLRIVLWWSQEPLALPRITPLLLAMAANVEEVSRMFWQDSMPSASYADHEIARLRARLYSSTQGLLEIIPNEVRKELSFEGHEVVEFMHRTVSDFLETQEETLSTVTGTADNGPEFDPAVAIMYAAAMDLRLGRIDPGGSLSGSMTPYNLAEVISEVEQRHGAQTAIADKVEQHFAESARWRRYQDLWIEILMNDGCRLYFEEKARTLGPLMLNKYPRLLENLLLQPREASGDALEHMEEYLRVLLSHVMHSQSVVTVTIGVPCSTEQGVEIFEVQFHTPLWEMALAGLCWHFGYLYKRKPIFGSLSDASIVFNIVLGLTPDLTGKSLVSEKVLEVIGLMPPEPTLFSTLHAALQSECSFCFGGELAKIPVASCDCELSLKARDVIDAIIRRLRDRDGAIARHHTEQVPGM